MENDSMFAENIAFRLPSKRQEYNLRDENHSQPCCAIFRMGI
jgi:hypothetical protein